MPLDFVFKAITQLQEVLRLSFINNEQTDSMSLLIEGKEMHTKSPMLYFCQHV